LKKIFFCFHFCAVFFSCSAQQDPPRLIIRGDDMGFTHSGNQALIKCYTDGIETSIEVLVPSPWFPEAVKLIRQNPGVDIGIHLDLTSEWETIRWKPLSDCPSLKDADGYFFPMVFPNKNYPGRAIVENKWAIKDVEKEFRAQIELALKYIPRISHLSAHMGCTDLSPEVRALTKKLAAEYHIPVDPEANPLLTAGYDGPGKTPSEKVNSFINMLNKLEPGKTYLFVDHPGLNNDELKAVYHIGYENVAEDRQGVTDLYTNEKVKAVIKQKGIRLIGYRDLVK
jgi:predicted glycoside hydrolase/deacetylase ChbG (UPF0249 family)